MAVRWRQMPRGQALAFLVLLVWAVVYGGDKDEQQGGEQDAAEPPAIDMQVDTPPASMMNLYVPAADAFVFTGIECTNGVAEFEIHLPDSASFRVDFFAIYSLTNFPWSLLDTTPTTSGTFRVQCVTSATNAFFRAGNADIDSDGDDVPDDREMLLYGTNPALWDSDGDNLADYAELFTHGTNPFRRDTDNDGMDDDEELLAGTNPLVANGGTPTTSIRFYYDTDDRLTGAFPGTGSGAVLCPNTPAGNLSTTAERSTP
jgi:hypothetical protein